MAKSKETGITSKPAQAKSKSSSKSESSGKNGETPRAPTPKSVEFRSRHASISETFKTRMTSSKKAGLVFPVSKILKTLKKGKYAQIIQKGEVKSCSTLNC